MTNIHASCVAIGRKGVLLLGASGAGKSDLALRLIDEGARLVADDRTDLFVKNRALFARAPHSIAGLIEMRGVGIIAVPSLPEVKLALAVRVGRAGARLPEQRFYAPPGALAASRSVPLIAMNGRESSGPAKIRLALAAFSRGLFRDSFNPR